MLTPARPTTPITDCSGDAPSSSPASRKSKRKAERRARACARQKGDVIVAKLSDGVYLARSPLLGDAQSLLRVGRPDVMLRQAGVLRHLTLLGWPGAPRYWGAWSHKGLVCLRIEYVHGTTAIDMLRQGRMTADYLAEFQRTLARLLRSLHTLAVLHLDVKPDNIVVRPDGSLCLIDWEHARFMSDCEGTGGSLCGTLAYLAPEMHVADSAAHHPGLDVWSFGVCVAVLLIGRLVCPAKYPLPSWQFSAWPVAVRGPLRSALTPEPDQRPTFDQLCRRHYGLAAPPWNDVLLAHVQRSAVLPLETQSAPPQPRSRLPDVTQARTRTRAQRSPVVEYDRDQTRLAAARSVTAPSLRLATNVPRLATTNVFVSLSQGSSDCSTA